MEEDAEPDVLDAGLIAAAQRVEHYEMAGYGTVRTYAKLLGEDQAAKLLQQTLDEEGETDKKLTELAESNINLEAASERALSPARLLGNLEGRPPPIARGDEPIATEPPRRVDPRRPLRQNGAWLTWSLIGLGIVLRLREYGNNRPRLHRREVPGAERRRPAHTRFRSPPGGTPDRTAGLPGGRAAGRPGVRPVLVRPARSPWSSAWRRWS